MTLEERLEEINSAIEEITPDESDAVDLFAVLRSMRRNNRQLLGLNPDDEGDQRAAKWIAEGVFGW